ncbi:MAG TPA: trypsin-like peptidase domain-containing protein, partial [Gaiellaceae bacterium]|nr:trypsin-like peptidase domain-containing protein [Gaiellaceae bacterium]
VGVVAGAIVGGRLANAVLQSGSQSRYAPLLAIGGALLLVVLFQSLGARIGLTLRAELFRVPSLRSADTVGGLLLGASAGLFLAWVFGVVALQLPGQSSLRQAVQRSFVLRQLNSLLPPRALLQALARIDPFPALGGPFADVPPPNPSVLRLPGVRAAAPSVVRVIGTACGLGLEGSGWVAAPGTVVTAAHVVAGESDTAVNPYGSSTRLGATVVAFDPTNDVAVLRVPDLHAKALPLVSPRPGASIAVLGYPEDGPFNATPGRIGTTQFVLLQNAYGAGPVNRLVTTLRGTFKHGDSGGPGVDANGGVQTMVFASRVGGGGFGVAPIPIRTALASVRGKVSTGQCAR